MGLRATVSATTAKVIDAQAAAAAAKAKQKARDTADSSGSSDAVPPGWIVIAGKAYDPGTCGWEEDEHGNKRWTCTGDATIPLLVTMIAVGLTVGVLALINLASKNPRTVSQTDFPNVSSEDTIIAELTPATDRTRFVATISTDHEMWLKSLEFYYNEEKSAGVVTTQGTRRSGFLDLPVEFCSYRGARLVLGKAKFMGILTQMYVIDLTPAMAGHDLRFVWQKD
jgi:hypothetical protein